jgi:hypothetical protein
MKTTTSLFREPARPKRPEPHQPMNHKMFTAQSQFYTVNLMKHAEKYFKCNEQPQYFIKPGWLVTNKSKGFVKLAYKAIAVDERGYPLIPDTTAY